jgi:hypothetical protein
MVDTSHACLSVSRQCELLGLSRVTQIAKPDLQKQARCLKS